MQPLSMTVEEWNSYERMFQSADRDGDGRLKGEEAAPILRSVISDRVALRVIWALIDRDKDGLVSSNEFCAGMQLAKGAALGCPLPSAMPNISQRGVKQTTWAKFKRRPMT